MYHRSARLCLLLIILVNVAYFRGFEISAGITSSYLVVLWTGLVALLLVLYAVRTSSLPLVRRWWLWVGMFGWCTLSFGVNALTRPAPTLAIQFIAELSLSFLLAAAYALLLDEALLKRFYRWFIGVAAAASLFLTVWPVFAGFEHVRRVGGYRISGAVNNISSMIGVGVVLVVAILICAEEPKTKRFELGVLPILLAGLLLTGSRAAMIGIVASLILAAFISDFEFSSLISIVGGGFAVVLVVLSELYDLSGLYRFRGSEILGAVNTRLSVYVKAIRHSGTEPFDLLFGGGMYRYRELSGPPFDTIPYPHNTVVSLLVHVGLPVAILFSLIWILNARDLFSLSLRSREELDFVVVGTLLSLIVLSMYAFTSGRVTRVFSVWMFLGIAEYVAVSKSPNAPVRRRLQTLWSAVETERSETTPERCDR